MRGRFFYGYAKKRDGSIIEGYVVGRPLQTAEYVAWPPQIAADSGRPTTFGIIPVSNFIAVNIYKFAP